MCIQVLIFKNLGTSRDILAYVLVFLMECIWHYCAILKPEMSRFTFGFSNGVHCVKCEGDLQKTESLERRRLIYETLSVLVDSAVKLVT